MKTKIVLASLGLLMSVSACGDAADTGADATEATTDDTSAVADPARDAAAPAAVEAPDPAAEGTLAASGEVPAGAYQDSCNYLNVTDGVLSGACKSEAGVFNSTSLDLAQCQAGQAVTNENGSLVCG